MWRAGDLPWFCVSPRCHAQLSHPFAADNASSPPQQSERVRERHSFPRNRMRVTLVLTSDDTCRQTGADDTLELGGEVGRATGLGDYCHHAPGTSRGRYETERTGVWQPKPGKANTPGK
ncbi:hypothetical protein BaRGS_00027655 [Batillaria attramentaria]|uniref:Uncharacterized protein n=1 Tax=Batillaria attramentaria TaxID=370345 RepID=A0ABD0K136_9CAEN